jgi:hypothetical protein
METNKLTKKQINQPHGLWFDRLARASVAEHHLTNTLVMLGKLAIYFDLGLMFCARLFTDLWTITKRSPFMIPW